ncbi:MAG: fibronectin type III domain-containing protein [Planctomycetaceae bacterium]
MSRENRLLLPLVFVICCAGAQPALDEQPANTWVKRTPTADSPVSPRMGYEGALAYDPVHRKVIRWGGHNQGGGGEQQHETWLYDPDTARWELQHTNMSPPGACCCAQNVFDLATNRYIRFPAFSGSHGWHWFRDIYLNNTTVWTYELATNTWRDMRPAPAPSVHPLRCAAWDVHHEVVVNFGGEGSREGTIVYDPYVNQWTRMNPQSEPPGRNGGNLAYDAARRMHVLHGTQGPGDLRTWGYDLRKNEWRDLKPANSPPASRVDQVLAYDHASGVIVALVLPGGGGRGGAARNENEEEQPRRGGAFETWVYDGAVNDWKKMDPLENPPASGNRARVMVSLADTGAVLLENRTGGEQQIWTYRYADPKPAPGEGRDIKPPTDVRVTTAGANAILEWKPSESPNVAGYTIHRGTGEKPWQVEYEQVARVDGKQTRFEDDGLAREKVHFYFVRAHAGADRASDDSAKARTQPRIVEDVVVSVISPKEVRLSWKPRAGADIVGYHVERAIVEPHTEDQITRTKTDTQPLDKPSVAGFKSVGRFERITREPLKEPRFVDTSLDLSQPKTVEGRPLQGSRFADRQLDANGKPYRYAVHAYRVRAVNSLGVEGGDSPWFPTIPSSPQFVFSKEDGDNGQLRWEPNPEEGLAGYRVYRMEGPKINGAGQKVTRLTARPVKETRYTDAGAGRNTKRYWIVAVDALGQEGFPSQATWHYREWRRFYQPFVQDWHQ